MTDSWVLKLNRAKHHLKEVDSEIRRFSDSHPYRAVDTGYRKGNVRKFKLEFTAQPDEMLPVIVGDVIHNIRSALDHVIVACVPDDRRRKASFPIVYRKPYDASGTPLDDEDGKAWAKMTTGLPDDVLALVKALQPFQTPEQSVIDFCSEHGLDTADLAGMALIGRWDNADKHRDLVTIASGLDEGAVVTIRHGSDPPVEQVTDFFCEDGAELVAIKFTSHPNDSDVRVEVRGTVVVALEVRKERGVSKIPGTLDRLIGHVREVTDVVWTLARGLPVLPHTAPPISKNGGGSPP